MTKGGNCLAKIPDLNYFNWYPQKQSRTSYRRWGSCIYDALINIDHAEVSQLQRRCVVRLLRTHQTPRWRPWSVALEQGKPKLTRIERGLGRNTVMEMPRKTSKGKAVRNETGWRTTAGRAALWCRRRNARASSSRETEENARVLLACTRKIRGMAENIRTMCDIMGILVFFFFLKCHCARISLISTSPRMVYFIVA